LRSRVDFNFLHRFDGIVWATIASPEHDVILIETRNVENKLAAFSALNFKTNTYLWQNKTLEEKWWINLTMVAGNVILFTIYLDTNNPDKKGILAYDLQTLRLLWWNNDFSVIEVNNNKVKGFVWKLSHKEVILDLSTGKEIGTELAETLSETKAYRTLKPVQYLEGTEYFNTVKNFLQQRLNLLPVISLEYLEYESLIFISYYQGEIDLANYLLVLSGEGDVLLKEKIDEQRKGIGLDTFFILAGCVFFVKNKVELVSYKIV
jgi:hypothetical protein